MYAFIKTRHALHSALAALLMSSLVPVAAAQQSRPDPRSSPVPRSAPESGFPGIQHPGRNQEHLLQWMDRHSNLTPDQQQKALEREPGFRNLPSQTQERMRERLSQLNNMSPDRRRRWLERNEAIARLAPEQRQQVRDAMRQFGSLPLDRKRQVAQAFRELRDLPPDQQQKLLQSDQYRNQFSPQEMDALAGLISIEPYHVIMPNRSDQPESSPEH
jgi:hypothetical protein